MEVFTKYLAGIDNTQHRKQTEAVLAWITKDFPNLAPKIAWNQPMFTYNDTFIIGFSVAKHHLAIAPEIVGINHFSDEIIKAGYDHTKQLIRIKWDRPVNFPLLEKIIKFNILDKADCSTFWRK